MTENDVKNMLERTKWNCGLPEQGEKWSENRETIAIDMAIKSLDEIQQYRSIGTVDECRAAAEKQRAKRYKAIEPCKSVTYYQCPCCNGLLHINEDFCGECGQSILWEEEDV